MAKATDDRLPEPTADIRARIRYLIAQSRHTQAGFAALTETDPGYLSRVLAGKQEAGASFINRIVVNLGVSKEWLVTGRDLPYSRTAAVQPRTPTVMPDAAPVYDVDVCAGCEPLSRMFTQEHIMGYVKLPGLTPETPLVPVHGNSMEPVIRGGSLASIRQVGLGTISWGQIYVVVLEDYRLIKYIRRHSDPKLVILHSANPEYDDMELPRSDIRNLFLVERIFNIDVLC